MDLERGLQVGLQIAKGLQLAHDAGIYHLDLKPANILLKTASVSKSADVSVKIIDFGLSQVAHSLRQEAVVQQSRSGLSRFGQAIFGTLDYAPPEQRGYTDYGEPSAKSDIFAFGKTLYRLLTKERPIEVEPEALEHAPDWFKLLYSCTRADPAKRPESAEQLVSRLNEIEDARNAKQRKQAELAKQKAEAEAEEKRQAELAKQKAEEEKRRQAELAKQKAEAEQKRQAEIARRKAEQQQQAELAKQKAEAEQKRQAEIARRKAEQQQQAELAKQKAEAEQKRQAEIARRKAEQEQQQQAELAKQKAEAEQKQQAEIARRKAEQERQVKLANYRYTDNGDGTVTDNRTGLIWLKNANCFGRKNWKTAMQLAAKLADGQCGLSDGSKPGDWRLPTKKELKAMIDTKYKRPVLSNATGTGQWKEGDALSGVQAGNYWSSTPLAIGTGYAWYVNFGYGGVDFVGKSGTNYVWPLRGGSLRL